MCNRKAALTAVGAVLGLVLAVASASAWWVTPKRTTYLTFSGPVGLPGVTLGAGTYVFELADPNILDIVRVTNKEGSRVYFTAFTELVARPQGLPEDRLVTLGEAPRGSAPPIMAWYPSGDANGRQFIYRAH